MARKRRGSKLAITEDALREAVYGAFNTDLAPFRQMRKAIIERYVGPIYNPTKGELSVSYPVNMVAQTVNTWMRLLIAFTPRALVTTSVFEFKPTAASLMLLLDHVTRKMNLKDSLEKIAKDAIFGMGIAKIGLEHSGTVTLEDGTTHDIMSTYVNPISLDNFTFDTAAHNWGEVRFIGDKFRTPKRSALESDLFDDKAKKIIEGITDSSQSSGFTSTANPVRTLSFNNTRHEMLPGHIELWNLWLPYENEVRTVTDSTDGFVTLRSVEWDGPEDGPYRGLGFNSVPDNLMPRSPLADVMELNELLNSLFVKMADQGMGEKQILKYLKGEEEDAQNYMNAKNMTAVGFASPESVKVDNFGGVSQTSFAFALQVKNIVNSLAGNLDALAGLAPQAETLGQEQIIKQSASVLIHDMSDRIQEFAADILRDIAYYEVWKNPLLYETLMKPIEGTDLEIPVEISAQTLAGDFLDYNFKIVLHSMEDQGPGGEIAVVTKLLNQVFFPLQEALAQQGGTIDFEALTHFFAERTGIQAIKELIKFEEPQIPPAQAFGRPPKQSPVTTRHEVRTNRSGATRAGNDGALSQMMMAKASAGGPGVQPNEIAGIGRNPA